MRVRACDLPLKIICKVCGKPGSIEDTYFLSNEGKTYHVPCWQALTEGSGGAGQVVMEKPETTGQ